MRRPRDKEGGGREFGDNGTLNEGMEHIHCAFLP